MNIPKDPVMLLSFINTQLRDNYSDIDELCASLDINKNELMAKLAAIDYRYDEISRQFK
ncbi:MAG: DUF4250 domain-containing protein [Lachnospiraceae bacterium]|nr:DUF4250 domain-containing protein [Lachnospiraceae bacterium]